MNLIDRAVRLWRYRRTYEREKVWIVSSSFRLIPLMQAGKWSEVEFNWKMVYTIWDNENGFHGFYHLHPPGIGTPTPSQTDMDTMLAWNRSLGYDLFCLIDNGWMVAQYLFTQERYGHFLWPHGGYKVFDTLEIRT